MAQVQGNVAVISIDQIIANLTEANRTATQAIANNSAFNVQLNADLTSINNQITAIDAKIQELQNTLRDMQGQVATNQVTIEQNKQEKQRVEQGIVEAKIERDTIDQNLQENQRQMEELQRELQQTKLNYEEQKDRLQRELADENAKLLQLNKEDRQKFLIEISDTQDQLRNLEKKNTSEIQEIQGQLGQLDGEKNNLTTELAGSKADVERLTTASNELRLSNGELIQQNTELNQKLEQAKEQMTAAINNLAALSETGSQGDTQQLITSISQQLDTIKRSLGIDAQQPIQVEEINRAGRLDENTKITKIYLTSNNQSREKTFTLRALIVAISGSQIRDYENIIQRINNSSDVEKINTILDGIGEGRLASVLDRVAQSRGGGRKTRKLKRRGTRKGRKTRRARKQKGGFQYKAHTRRKRISTTSRRSSNRRSSTRRTSSM